MHMHTGKNSTVDISTATILKIIAILLLFSFVYIIRDVIAIAFVAIVFASAVDPWIDALQRRKIPRPLGILIIYAVVISLLSLIIVLFVPAIASQFNQLTEKFPEIIDRVVSQFSSAQQTEQGTSLISTIEKTLSSFNDSLSRITSSIFLGVASFFGGLFSLVGVLVLTFYMTVEENGIKKFLTAISPVQYQPYVVQHFLRIQRRMGSWFRGQLILGLIIGALSFLGLVILGVPYALVLALLAGVTELVPIIGPIIGAIPAVFIAFVDSPAKGLFVLILYLIIQQLENNLIVPKVMQKVTGLNPLVVVIVMLIGAKVAGVLGLILAVPITIIFDTFLQDFFLNRKEENEELVAPQPPEAS